MASGKRNEKLGRQIQKDLSQLFLKNQHDWFESEFVPKIKLLYSML